LVVLRVAERWGAMNRPRARAGRAEAVRVWRTWGFRPSLGARHLTGLPGWGAERLGASGRRRWGDVRWRVTVLGRDLMIGAGPGGAMRTRQRHSVTNRSGERARANSTHAWIIAQSAVARDLFRPARGQSLRAPASRAHSKRLGRVF